MNLPTATGSACPTQGNTLLLLAGWTRSQDRPQSPRFSVFAQSGLQDCDQTETATLQMFEPVFKTRDNMY
ncbi:hypothetical protein CALVIDRAFT_540695 [Calocera viscosa TUFC12733]|uniref:Uncharacterized protein n=1 Tax=Calocera viscosa (strain TUFC12733) TaxID=1330018 RepID=A0A167INV6_CALVF|nr:hypothetical protein CALVIDRAFT_540695 [Calocera viscosa TUFC12733]